MFNQNHERSCWYLAVDQSYKIVDSIILFTNDIFFWGTVNLLLFKYIMHTNK